MKSARIVAGGGATELEVARVLKDYSLTIEGKTQMIVAAYAKARARSVLCVHACVCVRCARDRSCCLVQAMEMIPRQLAENAGFDAMDILNQLRHKHARAG